MNYTNVPPEALKLPDNYIPPEQVKKRLALKPDFSTLNEGQKNGMDLAIDYIRGQMPNYLSICVEGYAGVGKTYWENRFVESLVTEMRLKVAATAPTNKAVNVISDGAEYYHPKLQYSTIHKLLGLKEEIDERTGKQRFVPDFNETNEIENIDVLLVDEASMFPDDLFEMVYEHVREGHLKLIFVGDSFQIPPVGKDSCIPFSPRGRADHKIGIIRLTEIVRQALDSPIISYATAIREGRKEQYIDEKAKNGGFTEVVNGSGIIEINRLDKDTLYGICDLYFRSPMFEINPDFFKVIAWRNKTVNAVNTKVRSLIYQLDTVPKLMEGEKLVANTPISEPGTNKIIYTTNQEFEVMGFEIQEDKVYENKDIQLVCKYYVTKTVDKRSGNEKTIQIIHENDEGVIKALLDNLKDRAIKAFDPQIRRWLWKCYYEVARRFADIKYNYAITGHKAQGSTYDNCMVIDWDIMENFKVREALRILYVGVSRPKKYLFLVR